MRKLVKHIFGGIKGFFICSFAVMLFPLAKIILYRKRLWIVSERESEARDNGQVFFKFMRTSHKEINCFYAIHKSSVDFHNVSDYGNVIEFGSLKHFWYFCGAKFIVSSTTQGFCPSYYLTLLRKKIHLWGKYVFLQHGITKDNQRFLYKKEAKIDLFICGAEPEYRDIKEKYGYSENQVKYTGFPRFDDYHDLTIKRQILVMPTWRRNIFYSDLVKTDFYCTWNRLLNSDRLLNLLDSSNVKLYFYMHPVFQKYSSLFTSKGKNIIIADFDHFDLRTLLKESSALITDFSSIAFDFAYMKKPLIYYQFDETEFFKSHYEKGYFDYRKDGFGPVCNTFDEIYNSLQSLIANNFRLDNNYLINSDKFFILNDNLNSERIFDEIMKL